MKGGYIPAIDFQNEYNTCVIDACINSILNSNSLCNKLTSLVDSKTNPKIFCEELVKHKSYFSYFCKDEICIGLRIFYKYLLCEFVLARSAENEEAQNEIRHRLLYIYNLHDYERVKRPKTMYVEQMIRSEKFKVVAAALEKEFQEYAKNPLNKDGATNKFIYDAFPLISFHRVSSEESVSKEISFRLNTSEDDVYISFDFTRNVESILDTDFNYINMLVNAVSEDYKDFVCSDLIISQWALTDETPLHSVYYNMLDNTIQTNERVAYYPLNNLRYPQNNVHDVVLERTKGKTINICNYDPWNIFSIFIIECAHFQRIPKGVDKTDIKSLLHGTKNKNTFMKHIYDEYEKTCMNPKSEILVKPSPYVKQKFESDWQTYKEIKIFYDEASNSEDVSELDYIIQSFRNLSYVI